MHPPNAVINTEISTHILQVDVGPIIHQYPDHIHIAAPCREVYCGVTAVRGCLQLFRRLLPQQFPAHGLVSRLHSE